MNTASPSRPYWIAGSAVALAAVAWLGASFGSFLSTNIQGGPSCVALIRGLEALPAPYDPATGPLSISVEALRPIDTLTFEIFDGDVSVATIAADAAGTTHSGLWNGRAADGTLVLPGRYTARAVAKSARCATTLERPVMLRSSLISYVVLQVGEQLTLAARLEGDDVPVESTWESSDPSVVLMEGSILRAVSPGEATVAAGGAPHRSAPLEVHVIAAQNR